MNSELADTLRLEIQAVRQGRMTPSEFATIAEAVVAAMPDVGPTTRATINELIQDITLPADRRSSDESLESLLNLLWFALDHV